MKKLLIFLVFTSFFISCEKSFFLQKATLINYDYGMCMCCGGIFIEINNDTFRTELFPTDFVIDTFPLDVKIEYDDDVSACNSIDIFKIKLQ